MKVAVIVETDSLRRPAQWLELRRATYRRRLRDVLFGYVASSNEFTTENATPAIDR